LGLNLTQATDELYAAFARHRRPRITEGCAQCLPEDFVHLRSKELRAFEKSDFDNCALAAVLRDEAPAELLHFIPRLVELRVLDGRGIGFQHVFESVRGSLSGTERRAIQAFVCAALEEHIEPDSVNGARVVELLEDAWQLGIDVGTVLGAAVPTTGNWHPAAVARLVLAVQAELGFAGKTPSMEALGAWLQGAVRPCLLAQFEANPEHEDAGLWASAFDALDAWS